MKTLSIRQPWAWLIIHGGKDIENRTWSTNFRGRFYVHASKGCTRDEYEEAKYVVDQIEAREGRVISLPPLAELQRGGIIGSVELADCVNGSPSPWFFGDYGFVLRDPQPIYFFPLKGRLGFFDSSLPEGFQAA